MSVDTNAVGAKRGSGKICFNSGNEGHFGRDRNCPANGRRCAKCGKYGHFSHCCKGEKSGFKPSKHNNKQQQKQHSTQHHDRRPNRGSGRQANFVQQDMVHVSEDDPFVFTEEQTCTLSTASEPVITVKIGEISKGVLIDSGSAYNLISQDNFKELIRKRSKG